MNEPKFEKIAVGDTVYYQGIAYELTHLTGVNSILIQNKEDLSFKQVKIHEISSKPDLAPEPSDSVQFANNNFTDEEWQEAQNRLSIMRPLLNFPHRTEKDVALIAEHGGISTSSLYVWLRKYEESEDITALIPSRRGVKKGTKKTSEAVEVIIESAIDDVYLSKHKKRASAVIEEVNVRCKLADLAPPHPNTIRNRIKNISQRKVIKHRLGVDIAQNLYSPIKSEFPDANTPLSVVQIDHTQADIIVVDSQNRLPLGRPWLTLAIDVCTRMIVGINLSMDHPSAAVVGRCMINSLLPKDKYLSLLSVPGEWPVWGKMKRLHADNGKDFRGKMLKRACASYGIELQLRPVKKPHFGGHIERLMGTSGEDIRKLPGTTFSNITERKGYDSEKESALTLEELEARLVDFIVNIYHLRSHSALNMPPISKWENGILGDNKTPGIGLPSIPANPEKLRIDFLPFSERTVQRYGILLNHIFYYHESLSPWINAQDPENPKEKRKFIVKYDPRDLSTIYFHDPKSDLYFTIPYRNMTHPATNLWELKNAVKKVKEMGQEAVDEESIFKAIIRMRERLDESKSKTKKARREHKRLTQTKLLASSDGNVTNKEPSVPEDPKSAASDAFQDDIFSQEVSKFDEVIAATDKLIGRT